MPKVTRRQFLKVSGAAAVAVAGMNKTAGAMELGAGENSYNYARIATKREPAYTISPFGKLKSPLEVFLEGEQVVAVGGHPNHPATRGRSKAVDVVSFMALADPDRLTHPLKRSGRRGEGKWKKITWEEAIKEISEGISASADARTPEAVVAVCGEDLSGGTLKRFMDTLGSASLFQHSGDANKKAAQRLTWGEEMELPDFANSRYILNFGSNLFETFDAFAQAVVDGRKESHAKLITFDPLLSMTAGKSDRWVPIVPGTDGLVALAMANVIMEEGLADTAFINRWTNYPAEKLAKHLSRFTLEMAEEKSGVPADTIRKIAIEFAKTKPATVFSYRGASSHANGVNTERALMLLPIITGNIEVKGGYCLPRRIDWNEISPAPKSAGAVQSAGDLPVRIREGGLNPKVLMVYNTNPVYSGAAASLWREILKDEGRIPLTVTIASYLTETAAECDIVLPEAMFLERTEPVTSPSTPFPWAGTRTAIVDPPDEVKALPDILKEIVTASDPEGTRGFAQYWSFDDYEEWMTKYFEKVPGLADDGGIGAFEEGGVWPAYGSTSSATGKFLDDDEKELEAKYGLHAATGFRTKSGKIELYAEALKAKGIDPLPTWVDASNLAVEGAESLLFVTYKTAYQYGSSTANQKYLAEKHHANHCMINKETAAEMKLKDGDLIRLSSSAGYLVTMIRATNAIHPRVVAMSAGTGHRGIGPVAATEGAGAEHVMSGADKDVHYNLWWSDRGVNPNDIIPLAVDPAGGGAALACSVKVEPAKTGDRYGDVKASGERHAALFRKHSATAKG